MATFAYNDHTHRLGEGNVAYATDDHRLFLFMSNTTADTEDDITTWGGLTTPDWYDGTGGDSTSGYALDSEAWAKDASNNRSEFDAADEVLSGVAAGTRDCVGSGLAQWDTDRASSHPEVFLDHTDFAGNGGDVTFQMPAEGIIQVGQA
ncbi:MAG: hypothetical protein AAFZ07_20250 [Actinomycetota bacterium]